MIRREGRIDNPQPEPIRATAGAPKSGVVRLWEKPVLVLALIVILVLGAIGGLNSLIGLFPK